MRDYEVAPFYTFKEMAKIEKQKRKIDRIARDAEAAQRRAKGGHWK